jgi:hypothetical protein
VQNRGNPEEVEGSRRIGDTKLGRCRTEEKKACRRTKLKRMEVTSIKGGRSWEEVERM